MAEAIVQVIKTFVRFCCLVSFIIATLALGGPAISQTLTLKNLAIQQSSDTMASPNANPFGPRQNYLLDCLHKTCTGRLPLIIDGRTYYYDTIVTVMADGPKSLQINIDLHPIVPGCGPRCQPTLTAIFTSIPWARLAHVTVPVHQVGNFNPTAPSDDLNDAVYQVLKEPVAYLDLSIEFQ